MKDSARNLLASYVDALYPIIYINHFDFNVIDEIITDISENRKIIEFNNGLGIVNFKNKSLMKECDLFDFLKSVKDDGYEDSMFIVLKDVHNQIEAPEIVSLLKYIAERNLYNEEYNASIFIVSSRLKIPAELEDMITIFDIPLPSVNEIVSIMEDFKNDLDIDVSDDVLNEIAISFKGLNEFQIKQILNLAYQDGGTLDSDDKELILRQKEQLIKKAGLLEMITVRESIDDIGGLENLKEWLYRKEIVFRQLDKAIRFGVDIPKGILIVGMPGCGKSLTAKATATLFQIPLVRLDVGRLLGKYVGESEENMRKALKLAEAISPCALWIDEIEKAFSGIGGSGSGSDVTTRLFGQFLTWMQEKENTVFIVATANDISKIPPEFLRKGRFDELFYVDFPNDEERRTIIDIHLKKRHKWNKELDIISLVKLTEGYNGADLEAIIKDAVETCFIEGRSQLTTEDLKKSQENIKSISLTLKNRIKEIRAIADDMDLKPANNAENKKALKPQTQTQKIENKQEEKQELEQPSKSDDSPTVPKEFVISEVTTEERKDNVHNNKPYAHKREPLNAPKIITEKNRTTFQKNYKFITDDGIFQLMPDPTIISDILSDLKFAINNLKDVTLNYKNIYNTYSQCLTLFNKETDEYRNICQEMFYNTVIYDIYQYQNNITSKATAKINCNTSGIINIVRQVLKDLHSPIINN